MGVAGEAVVAHGAFGDEVAGAGGDVEHRHGSTRLRDVDHLQARVAGASVTGDGGADQAAYAAHGRVGDGDEPQELPAAPAQA